jgi:hypothetical protein
VEPHSKHARNEKFIQNLMERDYLEELGIDGKILLK